MVTPLHDTHCLTRAQDVWGDGRWDDRGHGRGTGVASSWMTSGVRLAWVRAWRIVLAWEQWGIYINRVGSRGLTWVGATIGREAICRGWWVIPALRAIQRAPGVIVPWRVVWPGHFTCEEGSCKIQFTCAQRLKSMEQTTRTNTFSWPVLYIAFIFHRYIDVDVYVGF